MPSFASENEGLTRSEVEDAIREGHPMREVNQGDADWRSTACDPTVANSLSSTTTQPEGMRAQRASLARGRCEELIADSRSHEREIRLLRPRGRYSVASHGGLRQRRQRGGRLGLDRPRLRH